jgi:hypothetical protein
LIGGDPLHRLQWGDSPGWVIQRETESGVWVDIATYSEPLPMAALPFMRWVAANTGLTFDMAEDAVFWLRDNFPSRFIDPLDETV